MRALLSCAAAWLCLAVPASADVFNGRIAFSSVRTDPQAKRFDIFSMPRTDRRCGDAVRSGSGAYDVRLAGAGVTCRQALVAFLYQRSAGR